MLCDSFSITHVYLVGWELIWILTLLIRLNVDFLRDHGNVTQVAVGVMN